MTDRTIVKALISDLRRAAYDAHQSAESDFEELFDEAADALEASLVDSKTLEIDANKAGCVPPAPLSTATSQPRGVSNERGPLWSQFLNACRNLDVDAAIVMTDFNDSENARHNMQALSDAAQVAKHAAYAFHDAAEIAEAKLAIPNDVRSALEWCSARENPDQFSDFDEVIVRDWLASHPKDSA